MAKENQRGTPMAKCARKWNKRSDKWRAKHSYKAFTAKCLKGKR